MFYVYALRQFHCLIPKHSKQIQIALDEGLFCNTTDISAKDGETLCSFFRNVFLYSQITKMIDIFILGRFFV